MTTCFHGAAEYYTTTFFWTRPRQRRFDHGTDVTVWTNADEPQLDVSADLVFVGFGLEEVFLVTGFANGGEKAWSAFLEGPYHHPNDDLAQKIDWGAGARFAEANYRVTRAMADGERPLWIAGDYFGDTFAPHAARAARAK